jgi:hypothetical protein
VVISDSGEKAGQVQASAGIFLAASIILALAINGDDDIRAFSSTFAVF